MSCPLSLPLHRASSRTEPPFLGLPNALRLQINENVATRKERKKTTQTKPKNRCSDVRMGHKSDGKRFKAFGDDFSTFIYVPINAISIMEIRIFILSTDMLGINWICRLHFVSFQMLISPVLCW